MKSYFKYELACAAGVSMRTFSRWLSQNTTFLAELGVMPTTKLIPAKAAQWICGQYGIDERNCSVWTTVPPYHLQNSCEHQKK